MLTSTDCLPLSKNKAIFTQQGDREELPEWEGEGERARNWEGAMGEEAGAPKKRGRGAGGAKAGKVRGVTYVLN